MTSACYLYETNQQNCLFFFVVFFFWLKIVAKAAIKIKVWREMKELSKIKSNKNNRGHHTQHLDTSHMRAPSLTIFINIYSSIK